MARRAFLVPLALLAAALALGGCTGPQGPGRADAAPAPRAGPAGPTAKNGAPVPLPSQGQRVANSPGVRVWPGPAVAPVTRVRVFDDDYEPPVASARVGEVIEWYHTGLRLHTVTALDASWDSGGFDPGAGFLMEFQKPGTYQYFCTEHPWMRGIVVVTE